MAGCSVTRGALSLVELHGRKWREREPLQQNVSSNALIWHVLVQPSGDSDDNASPGRITDGGRSYELQASFPNFLAMSTGGHNGF